MNSSSDSKQISSKEILARTGISRATLNNYIGLNLIPPPTVRKPEEAGGPTKIGYFPEWVVDRIDRVRQLKTEGMRMSQIVMQFMDEEKKVLPAAVESQPDLTYQWLEHIPFPAVLVNKSWEIIRSNHAAENLLLTERVRGTASVIRNNFFAPFFIRELMSDGGRPVYPNSRRNGNAPWNWNQIILHMGRSKIWNGSVCTDLNTETTDFFYIS